MMWLPIALSILALILAAHSFVFGAAATWLRENTRLWRTDPARARQMREAPPWYVRYAGRLL